MKYTKIKLGKSKENLLNIKYNFKAVADLCPLNPGILTPPHPFRL